MFEQNDKRFVCFFVDVVEYHLKMNTVKKGTIVEEKGINRTSLFLACLLLTVSLIRGMDSTFSCASNIQILIREARQGSLEKIRELIDQGVDINSCDAHKVTPLHAAAQEGHLEVVKVLLDNGASVEKVGSHENSVLHYAVEGGNIHIFRLLLRKVIHSLLSDKYNSIRKVVCSIKNKHGCTLLHSACEHGKEKIVELLLKTADIEAVNEDDLTPLHCACLADQVSVVKLLIKNQANIEAGAPDGRTPLHYACKKGGKDLVKLLLNKGANIDAQTCLGWGVIHFACEGGNREIVELLINKQNDVVSDRTESGMTPLHIASESRNNQLVELLLKKNAPIGARNKDRRTALHLACKTGDLKTMKLLVEKGADIEAHDAESCTPLYIACEEGKPEIVEWLLIKKGADYQEGAFDCACLKGRMNVVRTYIETLLEEIESESERQDDNDLGCQDVPLSLKIKKNELLRDLVFNKYAERSAWHCLCNTGDVELVKTFIDFLSDYFEKEYFIAYRETDASTVLHQACRKDHLDLARFLLDEGADIEARNEHGETPLHCAVEMTTTEASQRLWSLLKASREDVVKLLLNRGADCTAKDSRGRTPLEVARKYGSEGLHSLSIVSLLDDWEKRSNKDSIYY